MKVLNKIIILLGFLITTTSFSQQTIEEQLFVECRQVLDTQFTKVPVVLKSAYCKCFIVSVSIDLEKLTSEQVTDKNMYEVSLKAQRLCNLRQLERIQLQQ